MFQTGRFVQLSNTPADLSASFHRRSNTASDLLHTSGPFDWQPPIHWRELSEIRKLNLVIIIPRWALQVHVAKDNSILRDDFPVASATQASL